MMARTYPVMAGLVPAIHGFRAAPEGVGARDKPGHDGGVVWGMDR